MVNISDTIKTLLDRMDKFPNEFINSDTDVTDYGIDHAVDGSRWEGVTEAIISDNKYNVFTAEEINAYRDKLAMILRKKFDEDVCRTLVGFERKEDPRQQELSFGIQLEEQIQQRLQRVEGMQRLRYEVDKQVLNLPDTWRPKK